MNSDSVKASILFSVGNCSSWAEARVKIARLTLRIKLDGSWSRFQLASSAPPLSAVSLWLRVNAPTRYCLLMRLHMFHIDMTSMLRLSHN